MELALVLMVVLGPIAAVDGIYYHIYKMRLYRRRSARFENLTHWYRAASYGFVLWMLLHYSPAGGWFWLMAAVFAADFVDDVCDVLLEPNSRAPLGGLPRVEYLIHMTSMAFTGGIAVVFLYAAWPLHAAPTALIAHGSDFMPAWLRVDGLLSVGGAAALGLFEISLSIRAYRNGDVDRELPAPALSGAVVGVPRS